MKLNCPRPKTNRLHLTTTVCLASLVAISLWRSPAKLGVAASPVTVHQSRLLTGTNFTFNRAPDGAGPVQKESSKVGLESSLTADQTDEDGLEEKASPAAANKHQVASYGGLDVPRILKGFGLGGGKFG